MSGPKDYRLSETENRRIFHEQIVPDLLAGRDGQADPTTVVLLGQQGSGKTRISHVIAQELNRRGGFIDLDSDLVKPFHPAYAELMELDDQQMALHVGPDARQWTHQARAYAQEHRLNILAHDTAGDARFSADLLKGHRQAGYRVQVMSLGVPRALSDQGVLNRYYEQVQDRGQGRLSVPEKVEAAYTGMLEYADIVDAQRLADSVSVYRRGESKPRYINLLSSGQWEEPPRFRQALREARNTPWSPQETEAFLRVQDKLRVGMGPEFQDQLSVISQHARPLLHHETAAAWKGPKAAPGRPAGMAAAARLRSTTDTRRPEATARPAPGSPPAASPPDHTKRSGPKR
ncbi:zeta toxin family protein [Streptomyces sp. IGB124]|uniref:zeta toxin family protein n=1 Tax=Streptomyces sp. IGB124 TaxID=1519485 RepID=UPI0006AE3EBC|nr:zeta toxin family protein [Streptomyces sp. IGB124]